MYWNRLYAAQSYLRSALWIVPLIALLLEQIAIRLVSAFETSLTWVPRVEVSAAGITGVMDTVVNLSVSFIVFTFGSMLVAIQVASGQLTPRIIATTLLRDKVIRSTVGLFVFALLFAAGTRARVDTAIPQAAVTVSVFLGIASITMFLFLIDYTARLLRPITVVWRVGEGGIKRFLKPSIPMRLPDPTFPRFRSARSVLRNEWSNTAAPRRLSLPSIWRHSCRSHEVRTASSNSSLASAISLPSTNRYSRCAVAPPR